MTVALDIAETNDAGTQRALQQAYEKNVLRGRKLLIAKRAVKQRRQRGKGLRAKRNSAMSPDALLRAYRDDTDRKRFPRKAEETHDRLTFVTETMRKLLAD